MKDTRLVVELLLVKSLAEDTDSVRPKFLDDELLLVKSLVEDTDSVRPKFLDDELHLVKSLVDEDTDSVRPKSLDDEVTDSVLLSSISFSSLTGEGS